MAKRRSRRQPERRAFLRIAAVLFLVFFISVAWLLLAPARMPEDARLEVRQGDSLLLVGQRLEKEGWLRSHFLYRVYVRLFASNRLIYPGVYPLEGGLSAVDVVRLLTEEPGKYVQRFTVVEGIRYSELRDKLASLPGVEPFSQEGDALLAAIGATEKHPEGLFAPDTYGFVAGMSELELLRNMYQRQQRILAEEWASRAPGLPYKTPYEALIMASIVEKETGQAAERPQIAGVFVRRLQKGMRLQTDPTVIYGMGEAYDGNLRKADLLRVTPYNTYRVGGLPPTPIALPGRAAIHAALNPAPGESVYFVARGDGTHVFSATLSEHNAAVANFQKARRAEYHSAPIPAEKPE